MLAHDVNFISSVCYKFYINCRFYIQCGLVWCCGTQLLSYTFVFFVCLFVCLFVFVGLRFSAFEAPSSALVNVIPLGRCISINILIFSHLALQYFLICNFITAWFLPKLSQLTNLDLSPGTQYFLKCSGIMGWFLPILSQLIKLESSAGTGSCYIHNKSIVVAKRAGRNAYLLLVRPLQSSLLELLNSPW